MAKIITAHRREDEYQRACEYIRAHILLPSSLLGLVFMVAGMASLIYQFVSISYSWETFLESGGLLLIGILCGWAHTRYLQYLLREHPQYFAGRQRLFDRATPRRARKDLTIPILDHPGRNIVPVAYAAGTVILFAAAAWASMFGETYYVVAFLLPWMGFFWAKVYFWRGILLTQGKR